MNKQNKKRTNLFYIEYTNSSRTTVANIAQCNANGYSKWTREEEEAEEKHWQTLNV